SKPRATREVDSPPTGRLPATASRDRCRRGALASAARGHFFFLFFFVLPMSQFGGFLVDPAFGQTGQLFVGRLFFFQNLLRQIERVGVSHALRPSDQRAIRRHFVVFGSLPGRNQHGIHRRL